MNTTDAERDDLVERLRAARDGDHERGCQMRTTMCSCGFDEKSARSAGEAAARIKALKAENAKLWEVMKKWAYLRNTTPGEALGEQP